MMSAYSEDLRWRIVSAVEGGMPKARAARTFRVSLSSVKRYVNKAERAESLAPKKRPRSAPKLDDLAMKLLADDLEERPLATLRERCEYVEATTGARGVLEGGLQGDGGRERGAGEARLLKDECVLGTLHGRRSLRLRAQGRAVAPFGAQKKAGQEHHATLEHELGRDGSVAERRRGDHRAGLRGLRREGAGTEPRAGTDSGDGQPLSPPAQERVRELIEARGCELLYLPSYSPEYNPIEEAFAKIKNLLRKAAARTKGALVEAIGAALSAVTDADARGFFEHAGYRPTGHLL
jgi:transposase